MKKTFLFFAFLLICQAAQADIILLKNGDIIEGKVTQVRGIFIRVQPDYGRPFREFLIENVAHIEKIDSDEVSHLIIKDIQERAIHKAPDQQLQEAANKRAAALIEEAIQRSETVSLNETSDDVKAVVQEKASELIGEAVKQAETPVLIGTSKEIKNVAQEKASGIIEQAVKEVEVLPLQKAPEGVQKAAKKAATTLIGGAFSDVKVQTRRHLVDGQKFVAAWSQMINFSDWESVLSKVELTSRDGIIGGLLIFTLFMLLREKRRKRKRIIEIQKSKVFASKLQELDRELEEFDKALTRKKSPRVKDPWAEKREYRRVKMEFPVSLILDKLKPISAAVKNISLGGAYATCNDVKLLKTGDRCQFQCNLVDADTKFGINGKAEIVRIRANRGLGLKFYDLDEDSMNYLLKVS